MPAISTMFIQLESQCMLHLVLALITSGSLTLSAGLGIYFYVIFFQKIGLYINILKSTSMCRGSHTHHKNNAWMQSLSQPCLIWIELITCGFNLNWTPNLQVAVCFIWSEFLTLKLLWVSLPHRTSWYNHPFVTGCFLHNYMCLAKTRY